MAGGVLSQTEAPPFDIMGLLLGGRGYASGWFQNRDKLRMLDIAQAKELADRQLYTKGVLASPELKQQIATPYDRGANWNLWGKLTSGPESFVNFGNQQLNQSTGAIYNQEAQAQSNAYSLQQQQNAHDLAAANIKLSTDEQLRFDQIKRERDVAQQEGLMKYLFTPDESGATPGQKQTKRDMVGDMLGIKRGEGYSIAEGGNGLEPTIHGKVWADMMEEGQSVSNLTNSAEFLLNMSKTGTGDKDNWAAIRANMLLEMKRAEKLGTLDAGVSDFFASVVPEYLGDWGPDVSNKVNDMLETNIKLWKNKQAQIADKYNVPIDSFSQRKALGNEPIPTEKEATERFGNPVATPAPSPKAVTGSGAWGGN
jgi:hypothetical protein